MASDAQPQPSDTSGGEREALFDRLRSDLGDEQVALAHQIERLEDAEQSLGADEGFADTAQVTAEQGESRALASQLRDQLDDVEAAISRLAEGSYGRCVICDEHIADDRLEAMPATRYCITHASGS